MRNVLVVPIAAIFALNLAACTETAVAPSDDPGISFAVKLVDSNQRIPVAFVILNPCNPIFDPIPLSGTDHQIVKIWDNGNFKLHLQFNLSGTSAAGIGYKVDDQINVQDKFAGVPFTSNSNLKIISRGPTDNFVQNVIFHLSPNGNVTLEFADGTCRG